MIEPLYNYTNYTKILSFYYNSKFSNITMQQCAETCFAKAVVDVHEPVKTFITGFLCLLLIGIFFAIFKDGKYFRLYYICMCFMVGLMYLGTFVLTGL